MVNIPLVLLSLTTANLGLKSWQSRVFNCHMSVVMYSYYHILLMD